MRFLLNMNLPRALMTQLAATGHQARHVGDIGLARATDAGIIAEAQKTRETILTHDLDYGHLLAFSGDISPSVVIFRLRTIDSEILFKRLMEVWAEIERPLSEGAIVILEDTVLRVRPLPIKEI